MPIMVPCPKCGSNLSAPDDAAGKRVRCPMFGCGATAEVPGFLSVEEVAVVDAVAVQPARKPEPVVAEEVPERAERRRPRRERSDEWGDNPPRRRRRRSGPHPGAIVAIVLGGLLAVVGIGFGVHALVKNRNGSSHTDASSDHSDDSDRVKAAIPDGWVQHTLPGRFKAYFPTYPRTTTTNISSLPGSPINMAMTGGPRERLAVIVYAMPLPPRASELSRDQISEEIRQGFLQKQGKVRVVSQRSLRWAGWPALEMVIESSNKKALVVYRHTVTDQGMYLAFFACSTGRSPSEENGFFDNFEILE
jgi:hypothetical protein